VRVSLCVLITWRNQCPAAECSLPADDDETDPELSQVLCYHPYLSVTIHINIVLSPVPLCHHTHKHLYKPVGNGIFVPSPNFIAMATRVAHNILHGSIESAIPENPVRCKHLWSICHTSRLIGDFVQILGSKFWALWA